MHIYIHQNRQPKHKDNCETLKV